MINYHRITDPFNLFNVHTYPGWLERFGGDHPPQVKAMVDDILSGNIRVKMRDNSDVESFIDDKEYKQAVALIKDQYQKRTQKEIRIDDPIFSHRIFKSIRSRYTPSVGIINTLCKRGGSAKVSSSIAHSLGQSGITVSEYIGQTTSGEPPDVKIITNQVLDNTIKDVCQQKGLLDYHIQSTFELIDNSELLSHDVLHLHNLHGGYFNPFALPLIADLKPSVWTLHDMQALTGHCAHSFSCDRWQRGCGNCPNLKIYPEISTDSTATLWQDRKIIYDCTDIDITVPSKWLKSKVQKSMLKNKNIHVIANGIDTRIFKQYDKTQIRRMFNLPQDKIIIGFAANGGMTNPWKGGNCLHQAFINLSSKHNNILLLNIGGEFFAREYPVLNLPYTNDKKVIAAAYSACDILAYPALAESFGLVPLEAQACGLPVVAFCTGAIPEVVYHNKTGLLVEPNNTRQFTLALEKLICDDGQRKTLSANAASSVSADNSIEAAGDAYINLYFELIERRKRTNPLNKNHLLKKMKLRQNCGFFARKLYQCGNIKGYEAMLKYSQKLAKSIAGAKHLPAVSKK
jgi:glycosyltransferase involved in cell wall biosynthesis